eukprot:479672-Amphidinium_carterae.1
MVIGESEGDEIRGDPDSIPGFASFTQACRIRCLWSPMMKNASNKIGTQANTFEIHASAFPHCMVLSNDCHHLARRVN